MASLANAMKPIRTYGVKVDGYGEAFYSARSPAKARWRAFQDFGIVSTCSFAEFLRRSTIRRADDPPGVGARILVCGKPATRVIGRSPIGNYYMYDDSDVIYTAHDTEIRAA